MISIIIPVFNCEKYLGYAIESAIDQTYEDKEIIVVDDGSTDSSLNIALEYDVKTISKPNGGTGSALNAGISAAKGNWIKWLSADDILYIDALDLMMSYISKIPKHDRCIFYTPYDYIDENNNITGHYQEYPKLEQKTNMLNAFFGNGSTSLIHKSVFDKIGLFKELPHSEDYEFWLRALHNGMKMELIPYYTLKYRRHPDQLTNKVGGSLDQEIKKPYV